MQAAALTSILTWNLSNDDVDENQEHIDAMRMPVAWFLQLSS